MRVLEYIHMSAHESVQKNLTEYTEMVTKNIPFTFYSNFASFINKTV